MKLIKINLGGAWARQPKMRMKMSDPEHVQKTCPLHLNAVSYMPAFGK